MAFNVSEFSSHLNKRGLSKNNLFVLNITLPANSSLRNEITTRDLSFLCRSVDIPEMGVSTIKVKERGYGPGSTRPIDIEYSPLSTVFMVDSEFAVKRFFHRWMQEIVNYDVNQGVSSVSVNGMMPYEFGYKDDYAGTIEVYVFGDNSDKNIYKYKFESAFPISLGNVSVAWENAAEIMTMPVSFSYDHFSPDGIIEGVNSNSVNRANGLIEKISSINNIGQTIGGTILPQQIRDIINLHSGVREISRLFK